MDFKKFMQNTLNDLKTELTDEFDRNFQRKAFLDKAWSKNNPDKDPRRAVLTDTTFLRKSLIDFAWINSH
ncbi:MAG: hypothetical protein WDA08_10680 [Weeksellaceae bacterium]